MHYFQGRCNFQSTQQGAGFYVFLLYRFSANILCFFVYLLYQWNITTSTWLLYALRRHAIETISTLLPLCAGTTSHHNEDYRHKGSVIRKFEDLSVVILK